MSCNLIMLLRERFIFSVGRFFSFTYQSFVNQFKKLINYCQQLIACLLTTFLLNQPGESNACGAFDRFGCFCFKYV